MKIAEVLTNRDKREIPQVLASSSFQEVIAAMTRHPHTRLIYVVDKDRKLLGTITLGSLLRHLFPHHYEGKLHGHGILNLITADSARHLMESREILARPQDSVEQVLARMAKTGVKEMAVLDDEERIVDDITAIDLLRHIYPSAPDGADSATEEQGGTP
ncbi:MAG: CBS domain-containing protein [Desulfurivibrio sp.]|nr:CBS domain-containing protein [Desulfurivibrio sp.]